IGYFEAVIEPAGRECGIAHKLARNEARFFESGFPIRQILTDLVGMDVLAAKDMEEIPGHAPSPRRFLIGSEGLSGKTRETFGGLSQRLTCDLVLTGE